MKPTTPLRGDFSLFATTPSWLISFSLDLMRVLRIAFFVCFVVAVDQPASAAVSEKDKKFMTNLADRVPEQMLLGKLAEKQARSVDVINFAKEVITDRMALTMT